LNSLENIDKKHSPNSGPVKFDQNLRRFLMKKLLMIVILAVFAVSAVGCYGGGNCAHGVCDEEHSPTPPQD